MFFGSVLGNITRGLSTDRVCGVGAMTVAFFLVLIEKTLFTVFIALIC